MLHSSQSVGAEHGPHVLGACWKISLGHDCFGWSEIEAGTATYFEWFKFISVEQVFYLVDTNHDGWWMWNCLIDNVLVNHVLGHLYN